MQFKLLACIAMALEEAAVRDALQAELGGATPDDDVLSYAASCLADEDLEWGDAAGGCEGAFEAVGAVLADSLGGDDDAVRALLVRLASRLQLADNAPAALAADASRLIDLRGIRLAYGGRTLLKPTDFALTRGRRYALVGGNGVGKTTLLTRVAEGNIAGFPPALRRVYVQHEVLARTEQRVRDFMLAGLAGRPGDEEAASEALRSVGFSDTLAEAAVSELSGGWRMRLALARSTLQQVDLLLLDEVRFAAGGSRAADARSRPTTWTRARWPGCQSTCAWACRASPCCWCPTTRPSWRR